MQSLALTQSQRMQQKLTPAQIQVVRLLELASCELSARVNEELQDNPALEEGSAPLGDENSSNTAEQDEYNDDTDEYTNEVDDEHLSLTDSYDDNDDYSDYQPSDPNQDSTSYTERSASAGISFSEYLKSQVYLTHMDKPERHIAKFVVGNIDEDGYLRRSDEELCDDLYFREGLDVKPDMMHRIVAQVQQFDPAGVGAHNLQECLLLQLRQRGQDDVVKMAERILTNAFSDFSNRRYDRIKERFAPLSEEQLREVISEITRLNPKPGSAWQGTVYDRHQVTVIPDFIVENQDGHLVLTLNTGDIPALHVSRQYREMLATCQDSIKPSRAQKDAARFVKQKIESAQSFIDAIRQRNETLTRTMQAIMQAQHDWFIEGDETYLRPLVLQDIATMTGYDVSTISRVSNSKYVQTEFGILPLKFFFSEKMVNAEGEEVSTREIKKILSECIANEDHQHPLTDDAIVGTLRDKGYPIARRTVAKYREQLHIPSARLRKQL